MEKCSVCKEKPRKGKTLYKCKECECKFCEDCGDKEKQLCNDCLGYDYDVEKAGEREIAHDVQEFSQEED
jgi:hypothetical protein